MIQWTLRKVSLQELKAYEKNPRILMERKAQLLSDSLDKFGLVEKPVVNTDFTIISGHQRIEVMALKGATELEVWYPDRTLAEKDFEELNITLNLVNGDWDHDILANSWEVGDLLRWGFEEDELGLGKPEKKARVVKPVISLEFSDSDTMLKYLEKCEEIASESCAKLKVKG